MRTAMFAALIFAALLPADAGRTAEAPSGGDVSQNIINNPGAWTGGGGVKPEIRDDAAVQGGKALRFVIAAKGANPWDISANNALTRDVHKGDVLLVALWARAEAPAEGESTGHLGIRLQQTAEPYTAVAEAEVHPDATWKMYYASGVADRDYAKGSLGLTVHLAWAKQTIDFGPVFIVDFGPNYDRSKLPQNS